MGEARHSWHNRGMTHPWYVMPDDFAIPEGWALSKDDRSYLREQTWSLILKGDSDPEIYLDLFGEELEEAGVDQAEAERFFTAVIARRRKQQAALGGLPESALTRAFAELAAIGIVAREDFTCCGTCASAEIGDERDDSRQWRGYPYYHTQDAERIPEDHQTYVGYGAFLDAFLTEEQWKALTDAQRDETYTRLVTRLMEDEVFPVLEKHGVGVDWNRSLGTRIRLSNVEFFAAV